ncbi:FAD binding domain-containing protein [Halteromyces radiatus]|uniref:FAD binding domain-containing protein n=1 Tax=Halteromyces radiatus TaxID=101107 RepID=UPI002220D7D2|nr:FAD binding domain-containing protein [Halteromyces radiatus]KAI8099149.1 FAD binding domain-containing protein [Halteromyces radiatus]
MNSKIVAIVGGGLAGLSAAVEAHDQAYNHYIDATILLLEKENNIGGNSMKATSGINGVEPKYNDTMGAFYKDTIQSGGGQADLVTKLVQDSPSALNWLEQAGVDLSVVSQCGGHSYPRTHRCGPGPNGAPIPIGFKLVDTLKKRAQNLGIDIRTNARVTSITYNQLPPLFTLTINNNDSERISVDALILTSGGFGGQIHATDLDNKTTLLKEYAPQWVDRATTNGPWANGDGVRLGLSLGATTVDMDQVQIHPTGFVDPNNPTAMSKFLAPEALRAYGGILLYQGRRFVNELTTRDLLTQAILQVTSGQSSPSIWLLLSDQAGHDFGESSLAFYEKKGLIKKVNNNEDDLAQAMQLDDSSILKQTLEQYDSQQNGKLDSFGKSRFPTKLVSSPYYWLAQITPCVHYTMGGLKINTDAQILDKENNLPIPGLFGAGEVTGGVHGSNRLAGNSLLECVVYGRTAGINAIKSLN